MDTSPGLKEPLRSSSLLVDRIVTSRKRRRPRNRKLCPHCKQRLTLKTFKKHQKFFLRSDGTWMSDSDEDADLDCETEGSYIV